MPGNELTVPEGVDFDTFLHSHDNLAVRGKLRMELLSLTSVNNQCDQASGPASSDSDDDEDTNLEITKLSEVLSAINVSVKSCSKKLRIQ